MNFIQWCDDNNGFLTAILSLIGLILSVTAIVVSICTARLPYKKRIVLGWEVVGIVPGVGVKSSVLGMSASATNVGNRTVNLRYLGYAVKKDREYHHFNLIYREFNSKASLAPSEWSERLFYTHELIEQLSRENRNIEFFVYAIDTEGKEYTEEIGTVGTWLDFLSRDST